MLVALAGSGVLQSPEGEKGAPMNEPDPVRALVTLPQPSASHATCAWCHRQFVSVDELLEHIEQGHIE